MRGTTESSESSGGVSGHEASAAIAEPEAPVGKGGLLQRHGGAGAGRAVGGAAPEAVEELVSSTRGGGDRLGGGVLEKMNGAFGQDFAGVGIHTDAAAAEACRAMGAQAFTVGSDVYFGAGTYDPDSHGGQELIGHELTHVVQQRGGTAGGVQAKLAIGAPGDAHEQEADAMGAKAAAAPQPGAGPDDPNAPKKAFGKGDRTGTPIAADPTTLRMSPADVGFGARDYGIVGSVPGLVQSHIAQSVHVSGDTNWKSIWRSRWIVYDANDQAIDIENNWKHPDYTLKPETVKKGMPSDGGANKWTVRFEAMETGSLFGGDDASNFPWDQSTFHVYSSPIASPKFEEVEERGNQIIASDSFTPAEDGASYTMNLSGTSSRTDSGSETITTSVKLTRESEAGAKIKVDGVEGGFSGKVGFEAQRSIAESKGHSLTSSQMISRSFVQGGLKKGTTYNFNVYPKFMVLTGSANVIAQNMGVVSGTPTPANGSIRIWTGYVVVND